MEDLQRWDYTGVGIVDDDAATTPWRLASAWVEAARTEARTNPAVYEPTAMAVATVDGDGMPDVRVVLMRFFDPAGPGFVSSTESAKGVQIDATGVMAASLTWAPLFRAIRFRGRVERVAPETVGAYWRSRPWGARISARASWQSHPVESRERLEEAHAQEARRWPDTGDPDDVPAPDDWVGYRIDCDTVEFWAGRPDRLHDRIRFTRTGAGDLDTDGAWTHERLQP